MPGWTIKYPSHSRPVSTGAGGAPGPAGPAGPTGPPGADGSDGADGKTVLNGTGAPGGGVGVDGDFYIDTAADEIYGPKTGGAWGSGTPLVGPPGPSDLSVAPYIQTEALGILATDGADNAQDALDTLDNVLHASAEPHGLEIATYKTPTESTISYVGGTTREFSIAPPGGGEFRVYVKGKRFTFNSTQTVSHTDTEGVWYFYFNASGVLTASQTGWILRDVCPVALIYWDADANAAISFAEERHGLTMDSATHRYLHESVGTRFVSGLVLGDYTLSSAGVITASLTDGQIDDEDIRIEITHAASPGTNQFEQVLRTSNKALVPIFYRSGATGVWRKITASASGYLVDGPGANARHYYNQYTGATWQETEVGVLDFSAVWLFATHDIVEPIIAILGQRTDTSLANARTNNTFESLSFGPMPFQEWKVLYRLIFKSAAGVAAWPGKVTLEDVLDLRSVSNLPAGTYVATAHSALTGLSYAASGHTGFAPAVTKETPTGTVDGANVTFTLAAALGSNDMVFVDGILDPDASAVTLTLTTSSAPVSGVRVWHFG